MRLRYLVQNQILVNLCLVTTTTECVTKGLVILVLVKDDLILK